MLVETSGGTADAYREHRWHLGHRYRHRRRFRKHNACSPSCSLRQVWEQWWRRCRCWSAGPAPPCCGELAPIIIAIGAGSSFIATLVPSDTSGGALKADRDRRLHLYRRHRHVHCHHNRHRHRSVVMSALVCSERVSTVVVRSLRSIRIITIVVVEFRGLINYHHCRGC